MLSMLVLNFGVYILKDGNVVFYVLAFCLDFMLEVYAVVLMLYFGVYMLIVLQLYVGVYCVVICAYLSLILSVLSVSSMSMRILYLMCVGDWGSLGSLPFA